MSKVNEAATSLRATGQPQIMFDDQTNMMIMIGNPKQIEELQDLMKTLEEQLGSLPSTTDIRVYRLEYVDVNVAATILENMFNESAQKPGQPRGVPGQPQPPQQPGQPQQAAQAHRGRDTTGRGTDERGRMDEERGGRSRRDRESDRQDKDGDTGAAGPRPLLKGDRIRVFPDIRTRTLVIRAHPDDFRAVSELLLKIDRPSGNPGIDIRIFQLKNLNAGEVEQALKAILKIEDRGGSRRRVGRTFTSGMPGMPGSWQSPAAMIEQLQEQVLELQGMGEGKLAINPSEQITITSDGTTNSVIVSAPDEGMKLIEKLISKLEEQQVPLMVKTIKVEHADVGDLLPELEKVFERSGGGGRTAGGEVTPSRIGAVQISADVRTNQLVIRALKPDFEKIEPIVKELDRKIEGQEVQTFTLEHADASTLAKALSATYITSGGSKVGKPIRIESDASTNTLFVWADEAMRAKIAKQVLELEKSATEKGETRQITLTQANASIVAEKLNAAFGGKGGKGRAVVKVTGDSASGVLFVQAPPELFKQIEEAAKTMDTRTQLQIKSFQLKNAYATEILEQMKDMTMQLARQIAGSKSDIQLGVFAATADPRTNTLFITGDTPTLAIAESVIKQIDVPPSNPTLQTTSYFYLTKADASSVAATINALYANVPGKAVPPPKAYAEPLTNAVFVYATQPQLEQIKASVIDPLEKVAPGPEREIATHRLTLKYAKVDDVMATVSTFVTQRRQALAASGVTRNILPQDLAIGISADTNTNQLLLYCTKKNLDEIKALVDTIDVEGATTQAKKTRIFPIQYADLGSVAQALTSALSKPGQVSERDRVTVAAEPGTQAIVVTASPENMAKAEAIIADLDKETGQTQVTEQIVLENARASEVATTITNLLASTRRTSRATGRLPASVQAVEPTNSLLVSAPKTELEQLKGMIKSLDVKPNLETQRQMKSYVLQYVDLGSMITTVSRAFTIQGASRNPRDMVEAFGDYGTNTLIVAATEENHKKVEELIRTVDVQGTGVRKTYPFEIKNAVVDDVYTALTTIYAAKKQKVGNPVSIAQLRGTNKILVTCTEADQKEVAELIATLDVPGSAGEVEMIRLVHLSPTEASQMLTEFFRKPGTGRYDATLLYDLRITASESGSSLIVSGRREGLERLKALAEKLDAEAPTEGVRKVKVFTLKFANPAYVATAVTQAYGKPSSRAEIDQITAQPEYTTSSLVVSASPKNLERIEKLVAELDRESSNKYDRHIVKLQNAQADDVAAALTAAYQGRRSTQQGERPVMVASEPNTNQLIVTCTDVEFPGVKELIDTLDVPKSEDADRILKTFKLTYVEPSSLASAIQTAFQSTTGRRNPRDNVTATYDYTTGALIVAASKDRMARVEALVKELDQESQKQRPVRVIELKNAEASDVANSLSQMFMYGGQKMRQGEFSIRIQHLAGTNRILVQANDAQYSEIKDIVATLDQPDFGKVEQMRVVTLNHSDANETLTILQEFLRKSGSYSQRGNLAGDVRVAASSTTNAIVISGSKDQVDRVETIVKQLDTEVEGANEPQMIGLKVANASQMARTLTQVFTDAARSRRGRTAPETVPLIIADERSNSLVVRARPSDYKLIEKMITDMDKEPKEGLGGVKVIAVAEGINVSDLAQQIEKTINAGQQQRARENPGLTPMAITVGSDTRTNTLMVSGSPGLFPEVERLVSQLEKMKPPGGTGVLIVPLKNVRPEDVKRVIDQMQQQRHGRRSSADLKDSEIGKTLRHAA